MKIFVTEKQMKFLVEQIKTNQKGYDFATPIKEMGNAILQSVILIKKHEGFCDNINRKCPPHTVGYGTRTDLHPELKNKKIDDNTATNYIKKDLEEHVFPAIKRLVKVPLSAAEAGALASLIYNIGPNNFAKSQLLKELNKRNMDAVKRHWEGFTRAEGKKLKGLVNRRFDEIKTFFQKL